MEVPVDPLWVEICRIRPQLRILIRFFKIDVADFSSAELQLLYLAVILIIPVYIYLRYERNGQIGYETHYLLVGWKHFINLVRTVLQQCVKAAAY